MSTPNQFTDEQVLAQLLAEEQTRQQQAQPGQQPPPLPTAPNPKIKIGTQEFDASDTAGIQGAIQEQQNEFSRIQTLLQEQQYQPQAPPIPVVAPPAQQPAAPRSRKKAWTPDNLAEEIKQRALPEVFDEMLGNQLGVDSLLQAIQGMAQRSMNQEQAFLEIAKKVDGLDGRISQESRDRASETFLSTHEDYLPSNENMQMIDAYLRKDGLQWNNQGLHLAYLHAKSDNMLKLGGTTHQTQQTQQTQQVAQPHGATAQPSLRGGASGMNTQQSILDKFNTMDLSEQARFIESFQG